MAHLGANALFPEYDVWTQFIVTRFLPSLQLDSLQNSHPVDVEVSSPSEINHIFDFISYNKGASILRMLHEYVGNEAFKLGIKTYLGRFSFKNVVTGDLWNALEEASGKPVGTVMSTWACQMGFPVITICRVAGAPNILEISQEKFATNTNQDTQNYRWIIPIKIICANGKTKECLLETKKHL